jgi:hypothetical protein
MGRYFSTASRTPEAKAVVKSLNDNSMKSYEQVASYSASVLTPAVRNIARVANWVTPQAQCNSDDIYKCIAA